MLKKSSSLCFNVKFSRLCHRWIISLLLPLPLAAQDDQSDMDSSPFSFDAFVDVYYLYDFNKPSDGYRPSFVYAYNRAHEVNINLAYGKASYTSETIRGNVTLMTGTYTNANMAAEPGVLKNMYEANAGIKISSTKNMWIDAGVFPSHIGFESAHGPTCWTLTRSILADNSPYFETGAKISYTSDNEKWFLSALILNGWQRIQMVEGNTLPSGGSQITFTPHNNLTLNSSTFIGTDKPDSARLMRYFHNFYSIIQISQNIGLTAGFDFGLEEKSPDSRGYNKWFSPIIILRIKLRDKLSMAARAEYYADKNGVIISTGTADAFKATGVSLNLDYQLLKNAVWRMEARNFTNKEKIFTRDDKLARSNTFITTSLAINFR